MFKILKIVQQVKQEIEFFNTSDSYLPLRILFTTEIEDNYGNLYFYIKNNDYVVEFVFYKNSGLIQRIIIVSIKHGRLKNSNEPYKNDRLFENNDAIVVDTSIWSDENIYINDNSDLDFYVGTDYILITLNINLRNISIEGMEKIYNKNTIFYVEKEVLFGIRVCGLSVDDIETFKSSLSITR